jgi:hypothetical protein
MARKIYVDVETGQLVSGLNDTSAPNLFAFEGDNRDYELYFLEPQTGGANYYEVLNYDSRSVRLHIGPNPPSSATPYVAATAGAWSNLSSTATASLTRAVTGTTVANEQQLLTITPDAIGGTFALTYPSQSVTFTTVTGGVFTTSGSHGLNYGQAFVITGFGTPTGGLVNGSTYYVAQVIGKTQLFANTTTTSTAVTTYSAITAGTAYTLTATTTAIDGTASVATVQQILEGLSTIGTGNIRVTGAPGRSLRFTFINEKGQVALPLMTVAQALTPIYGKTGTLNFNTTELLNAISASASIEATLEIETTFSGKTETVAQALVTLNNDIITSTVSNPTTLNTTSILLQSPNGSTFAIAIDEDGLLTTAVAEPATPATSFNLAAPNGETFSISVDDDGLLTSVKL